MNEKVFGLIDIGSNELRLRIAERDKDYIKLTETLTYHLSLGKDTFNAKKISFEKLDKTCEIIKNFQQVMKEYGVDSFEAVGTTAVREAINKDYILDQIKVKTGLDLKVLDSTDEKLYIYKLMFYLMEKKFKQSAMLVYIGSGGIGFSIMENEKIIYTQNVKIGTLRVFEIFEDLQESSREFYKIIEEYLSSFTDPLKNSLPDKIEYFIASGHEVSLIANLTSSKREGIFFHINKNDLLALYEKVKTKTVEEITMEFNISSEQSEILLPALCIYKNLLEMTKADKILAPLIFISDSILFEIAFPDEMNKLNKEFDRNALHHAKLIGKKYNMNEIHSQMIETYSSKIFDKMKKIHGLEKKEKTLLKIASVLHDVGKFINPKEHYYHSYNIIKALDIIGLNKREINLIANIALYHSEIVPSINHNNYGSLPAKDRVLVSKLSAILRLAESLDKSHKQKIKDIDVKITEDKLHLTLISNKNTLLEEWSFKSKGGFFEEVFGLKLKIRIRRGN